MKKIVNGSQPGRRSAAQMAALVKKLQDRGIQPKYIECENGERIVLCEPEGVPSDVDPALTALRTRRRGNAG